MSTVPTAKVLLLGDASVGKTSLRSQFIHHRFSSAYRATVGGDFLTAKVHTSSSRALQQLNSPRLFPNTSLKGPDTSSGDITSNSILGNETATRANTVLDTESISQQQLQLQTPDPQTVSLQIWDTAGQERFNSLVRSFFRGSDVAILVYDVTNASSFSHLTKWLDDFALYSHVRKPIIVVVGNKIDNAEYRTVSARQAKEFAETAAQTYNLQPPPPGSMNMNTSTSPFAQPLSSSSNNPNNNNNRNINIPKQVSSSSSPSSPQSFIPLSLGSIPASTISQNTTLSTYVLAHESIDDALKADKISGNGIMTINHNNNNNNINNTQLSNSPSILPQQQQLQEPAIRCFEVSAKENLDVEKLFTYVADRIVAARRDVILDFDTVDNQGGRNGMTIDIGDPGGGGTKSGFSLCC